MGARMQAVLRGGQLLGGEELACSTVQCFTNPFGSLMGVERNRCAVEFESIQSRFLSSSPSFALLAERLVQPPVAADAVNRAAELSSFGVVGQCSDHAKKNEYDVGATFRTFRGRQIEAHCRSATIRHYVSSRGAIYITATEG
jgi:hypothetical protein